MANNDGLAIVYSDIGEMKITSSNSTAISINYEEKEPRAIIINPGNTKIDIPPGFIKSSQVCCTEKNPRRHKFNIKEGIGIRTWVINDTLAHKEKNPAFPVTTKVYEKRAEVFDSYHKRIKEINTFLNYSLGSMSDKLVQSLPNKSTLKSAVVVDYDEYKVIAKPAVTLVEEVNKNGLSASTVITPATTFVEDYKPPSFNPSGSGSGLKLFKLTLQQQSFAEAELIFDDSSVINAIGLPYGLIIDKSKIKGTPLLSGTYPVQFELSNGRIVDGLILVPGLPRKL
jgi:hypothetical protein